MTDINSSTAVFPLALLRMPYAATNIIGIQQAQREVGQINDVMVSLLTIEEGKLKSALPAELQQQAIELALQWLAENEFNLNCPLRCYRNYRALVEADKGLIAISLCELPDDALVPLALCWVLALYRSSGSSPVESMTAVARCYCRLSSHEQKSVQNFLAYGEYDAGQLAAIFLRRVARVADTTEIERWTNWFIGQCRVDLPYNRQPVIDLLEADIDPDERRLMLAETVRNFDFELEEKNIARLAAETRVAGQELIFGRMSRAFHNQGLLFANAGYVQCNNEISSLLAEIRQVAANHPLLMPAVERINALLTGDRETAMTGILGAIGILENSVLDNQRKQLEQLLQAEREERVIDSANTEEILARVEQLLSLTRRLRRELRSSPAHPAAYVIFSQRFSATGSHLFARINEAQEPYLGKAENLKMLVRKGGQRLYASPDYRWLHHADHWIEAIPLFIKERVLVIEGVEVTETVIDQQAMEESFREEFAEHWAENINNVQDSEHIELALKMLDSPDDVQQISITATRIAAYYRSNAVEIHQLAEARKCSRYDALHQHLALSNNSKLLLESMTIEDDEVQRLAKLPCMTRRPLPSLHVLTTQSARMSDGYIRSWLEESMALYNVCRAYKLEGIVADKIAGYRAIIVSVGKRLIHELGMWPEVEELMAREQLSEQRAVARIIAGNVVISHQLAIVMVLAEHYNLSPAIEPQAVEELLRGNLPEMQQRAVAAVFQRNEFELLPEIDSLLMTNPQMSEEEAAEKIILATSEYADDLQAFARFSAREMLINNLDKAEPTLKLSARATQWMRNHTRLAKTTARREALLEAGLNHLTLHPLYYYRATGGNKRFHQLLYPQSC